MPQPTFPIYSHGVRPFLRLREFLAVVVPPRPGRTPGPTIRTVIPPPGQGHQARQRPTGITVRLEQRPDTGLFLVIGDDITYQVVSQPMPRRWWHSRSIQSVSPRPLEPGHPLSRFPRRGWLAELTPINFNAAAARRRQIEEGTSPIRPTSPLPFAPFGSVVDQATEAEMPAATPAERARTMAQARLLAAVPDGVLDEWLAAGNTLATVLKKARRFAPVKKTGGTGGVFLGD